MEIPFASKLSNGGARIWREILARKSLDNGSRASIDSHRPVVFRFTPSRSGPPRHFFAVSFLPTRDNSAPCCDSIARLFRINLAAGINQHASSSVIPRRELDIYTAEGPFDPRTEEEDTRAPTWTVPPIVDLSDASPASPLHEKASGARFLLVSIELPSRSLLFHARQTVYARMVRDTYFTRILWFYLASQFCGSR